MLFDSIYQILSRPNIFTVIFDAFENVDLIHFLIIPHFANATRGPTTSIRFAHFLVLRTAKQKAPKLFGSFLRSGGDGGNRTHVRVNLRTAIYKRS